MLKTDVNPLVHVARPARSWPRAANWVPMAAWVAVIVGLAPFVFIKLDLRAQFPLAFSVVAAMLVLRQWARLEGARHERTRLFFLLCSAFLTLRYLYWRTTETLGYNGLADAVFMFLLYGAELYGIVVTLLGLFVNSRPLERASVPLIADAVLPRVDVFIPTYNEEPELLEVTLRAALNMRYPRERLNVYLLDDGGTEQKCSQPDAQKAAAARERASALRKLAERHGGIYLTRARNEHAKAGNINAAMTHTHGDLITIFDADHVPTVDFLEKTVGFFQRDDKLFLVQTPHFFINPDPLEKNLGMFGKMPPENEMFYSAVQKGLDFWNAAFFCGSAAVLRRRCLEEIGGVSGTSITEDAETALALHARGYRSVYLNEALISGLQPETFASFIVQRARWAQGMIQIFLLRNPLRLKGLSLPQRLCYFSNAFFWFFCYARLVFLFAPVMYLVFGLQFYNATIPQFFAYGLPQLVASILTSDFLFGRYRWTLISEVYELLQSMFSLRAVISVMLNPRAPSFKVTPKGERIEEDTISELAGPFYVVYAFIVMGAIVGIWRLLHHDPHADVVTSSLCWIALNLLQLNACIGVLNERKQRRNVPRVPVSLAAQIEAGDGRPALACEIVDMSAGGVKLVVKEDDAVKPTPGSIVTIEVFALALARKCRVPLVVRNVLPAADGAFALGTQFCDDSVEGRAEQVALVFGDSNRWREFRASRNRRIGILRSLAMVASLGTVHAWVHSRLFFSGIKRHLRAPLFFSARLYARVFRGLPSQ